MVPAASRGAMSLIRGIYAITNRVNGHQYIGSSGDMFHRYRKHRELLRRGRHHSAALQRAWAKYGEGAFGLCVLEVVDDERPLLCVEQEYLDRGGGHYNCSKSASGPVLKGQKLPPEWVAKVAEGVRKRYACGWRPQRHSVGASTRALISVSSKRTWAEHKDRILLARGPASTELRGARRDNAKRLWADAEYRARAVAARKGRAFSAGYKCTPEQVENRKKAGRISNAKRTHGAAWREEYARRYPSFIGDVA